MDEVIEGVLFGEEVFQLRVADTNGLVEKPDVAARAKNAKRPGFAHAPNGNGLNARIFPPRQKTGGDGADHAQRDRIECTGPVQGDTPHLPPNLRQHLV